MTVSFSQIRVGTERNREVTVPNGDRLHHFLAALPAAHKWPLGFTVTCTKADRRRAKLESF